MSNIDKQALRQLAVDAKELAIIKRYTKGIEAQKKFIAEMTPVTVLALLDELEAAQKLIAELEAVKCKLSDSKLLSLAKAIVENLVDTGGSDPEYTQQYVDWTFKRIRAAAGKGE